MSATMRATTIALVLLPLVSVTVAAQTPEFLGSHRDWNVYAFTEEGEKICYMASEPKKQEGDYTRRGNPAILVTRRPGPKVVDEVSIQAGYTYLEGSEVQVSIGNRKFALFTADPRPGAPREHAWTKNEEDDRALINAMKGGNEMTVRGTSVKRTYSLDTYSLLGFTAAYEAMVKACS
jgi:Invasion associated locus B (IalB) protein